MICLFTSRCGTARFCRAAHCAASQDRHDTVGGKSGWPPAQGAEGQGSNMIEMTEQQAYAAVFHFLEEFWKRTKSDDVGMLLSSMSILQDGQPADAAITADWQEA